MWKQILLVLSTLIFAFGVLFVSVFRTASVKYDFDPIVGGYVPEVLKEDSNIVEYYLPYPGKILPNSPLWPIKAFRDRLWLLINTSQTREAELKLLFADKRLGSAISLFEEGKFGEGLSIYTKAEKYLEEASLQEEKNRLSGGDTSEFLTRIATASLKHYELSIYLVKLAPDDVKPTIINVQNYAKKTFERSRNGLLEKGVNPPENPFSWE